MPRLNHMKLSGPAAHALFALTKAVEDLGFDKRLSNLIKIRASQMNGCLFCLDMHTKEAMIKDERQLRLVHLPVWRESNQFDAREKAALEWTELLTKSQPVHDSDYEAVLKHFSEKELSDLTYVVSTINAWNRFGVAFTPEAGSMDKVMGLEKAGLS